MTITTHPFLLHASNSIRLLDFNTYYTFLSKQETQGYASLRLCGEKRFVSLFKSLSIGWEICQFDPAYRLIPLNS